MVELGLTKVIAALKIKISRKSDLESNLFCSVDANQSSSHLHKTNTSLTRYCNELASKIHQTIVNKTDLLDKNDFLIRDKTSKAIVGCYVLCLDFLVINDDGLVFDAAIPAAIRALGSSHWPGITGSTAGGQSEPVLSPDGTKFSLCITTQLFPLTFSIVPQQESSHLQPSLLVQPTALESLMWDVDCSPCYILFDADANILDGQYFNLLSSNVYAAISQKTAQSPLEQMCQLAPAYISRVRKSVYDFRE